MTFLSRKAALGALLPVAVLALPSPAQINGYDINHGPNHTDQTDQSMILLGPRVDVRADGFATGTGIFGFSGTNCVGVAGNPTGKADRTGVYDSTCAFRNWAQYIANTTYAGVRAQAYIPSGTYLLNASGLTGAVVFNGVSVNIRGDGHRASILHNTSPSAAAITIANSYSSDIADLGITGNGHAATGDAIDVVNISSPAIHSVYIYNVGGTGINYQGASERGRIWDVNIELTAHPMNGWGNDNEDYLSGFDFTYDGRTADGWYYDSNSNPKTGVPFAASCTTTSGQPTWASGTTYSIGQTVIQSGVTYNSAINNNSGNTPQLSSTAWNACGQLRVPENRHNITWNGDNDGFENGSIKGTYLAGIDLPTVTPMVKKIYCEAGDSDTLTAPNDCVQIVGKLEMGQLQSALPAGALTATVDDALWQKMYVTDPAWITSQSLATTIGFNLYPRDYTPGSVAVSTFVPGLLQGQYESVSMGGFANDNGGTMHLLARQVGGGTTAGIACQATPTAYAAGTTYANTATVSSGGSNYNSLQNDNTGNTPSQTANLSWWQSCGPGQINSNVAVSYPAPVTISGVVTPTTIVEEAPTQNNGSYGTALLVSNHLDMEHYGSTQPSCNDTTPVAGTSQWEGSTSRYCAEVVVGAAPDGFSIPTLANGQLFVSGSVELQDNTLFSDAGTLTPIGYGTIGIPTSGNVIIDQGNLPLSAQVAPATAFNSYRNAVTAVKFTQVSNTTGPSVTVRDLGANYYVRTFGGLTNNYNTLDAQIVGQTSYREVLGEVDSCTYMGTASDSTTPNYRFCLSPGNPAKQQTNNGGTWITTPGAHTWYSETGSNAFAAATLPVAPSGTIAGDGGYRAGCSSLSGAVNAGSYWTGINFNSNLIATFNPGLPPGVVWCYGGGYGYANDTNTGQTGLGVPIYLYNTSTTSTAAIPAGMTVTLSEPN